MGLIRSGLLSTRPISRLEGARLAGEAVSIWNSLPEDKKKELQQVSAMLRRLEREFKGDLDLQGYFKPAEGAYLKYLHSDNISDQNQVNKNNNGDTFDQGHNGRVGIYSALKLWDRVSFYINPEFRTGEDDSELKILHGYGILSLYNLDTVIGREPMWWGPGFHGGLLLTDNAEPFDMLRLTSRNPFILPSFLKALGPLKPTWFLTELEKDREIPHAKLMGVRLDFRMRPSFRFALSRVIMFNGEGREGLSSGDWLKILLADDKTEHADSGIDNNNILLLDFSLITGNYSGLLPFSGLKFYGEIGAEDSSGNGWPKEKAFLAGLYVEGPFSLNNTSFRVEWATTAKNKKYDAWYNHHIYTSGYTYKGNIIGHHMGTDADDLFVRFEYYTANHSRIGVETDIERKGIHADSTEKRTWAGLDLTYPLSEAFDITAGYGYEDADESSSVLWTKLGWDF